MFRKEANNIRDFADGQKSTVEGFQELNRVEITQEKEIYGTWELLSVAKELMGSSELLETDINCKVTLLITMADNVGKPMTWG